MGYKARLGEEELTLEATVRKFRTVQKEGEREVGRNIAYYNLDTILAIGYRVRSNGVLACIEGLCIRLVSPLNQNGFRVVRALYQKHRSLPGHHQKTSILLEAVEVFSFLIWLSLIGD